MNLSVGDWVFYRKWKTSESPGPRAKEVYAAPKGEQYYYCVDKFWIVAGLMDDDKVWLQTRKGKSHVVSLDDPHLSKANWWQRLVYRNRFKEVEENIVG